MTPDQVQELHKLFLEIQRRPLTSDVLGFNVSDSSGDNLDDAYALGVDSGESWLARSLLKKFFKEEVSNEQRTEDEVQGRG